MSRTNFTFEYKMLLGKIKQARLSAGLTQVEAAAKLRRTQSFISKIESGERRVDVIELAELARLYNASFDWMLSDVAPKAPKHK